MRQGMIKRWLLAAVVGAVLVGDDTAWADNYDDQWAAMRSNDCASYYTRCEQIEETDPLVCGVPSNGFGASVSNPFFRHCAAQGYAKAQVRVGYNYFLGQGDEIKNYRLAVDMFRKAATQGNAEALDALATMYYSGRAVQKDKIMSYMLYNLSAAKGLRDASKSRDIVAGELTPDQIAKAQEMARVCVQSNYKQCGY